MKLKPFKYIVLVLLGLTLMVVGGSFLMASFTAPLIAHKIIAFTVFTVCAGLLTAVILVTIKLSFHNKSDLRSH